MNSTGEYRVGYRFAEQEHFFVEFFFLWFISQSTNHRRGKIEKLFTCYNLCEIPRDVNESLGGLCAEKAVPLFVPTLTLFYPPESREKLLVEEEEGEEEKKTHASRKDHLTRFQKSLSSRTGEQSQSGVEFLYSSRKSARLCHYCKKYNSYDRVIKWSCTHIRICRLSMQKTYVYYRRPASCWNWKFVRCSLGRTLEAFAFAFAVRIAPLERTSHRVITRSVRWTRPTLATLHSKQTLPKQLL